MQGVSTVVEREIPNFELVIATCQMHALDIT